MKNNTSKRLLSHKIVTPIKINLALHIIGQRDNGYHDLQSLVCFAQDGDVIYYSEADEDSFSIHGPYQALLGTCSDNLVTKARLKLRNAFPKFAKNCHLQLTKNLPPSSGVGGGSGDAAAVLHILSKMWGVEAEEKQLYALAIELGADVPMCLSSLRNGQNLLVENIGEKITPLPKMCNLYLVLINNGQEISTPCVFNRLKNKENTPFSFVESDLTTKENLIAFLKTTRNDLYPPALELVPELANVLNILNENGAVFTRMSGSGATCFGIFFDEESAKDAALKIAKDNPDWYVKAVKTMGSCINDNQ